MKAKVDLPIGNQKKAEEELGWIAKTGLDELYSMLFKSDIAWRD